MLRVIIAKDLKFLLIRRFIEKNIQHVDGLLISSKLRAHLTKRSDFTFRLL